MNLSSLFLSRFVQVFLIRLLLMHQLKGLALLYAMNYVFFLVFSKILQKNVCTVLVQYRLTAYWMDSGLQPPTPDSEDLQRYSELQWIDLETRTTHRHETLYIWKKYM